MGTVARADATATTKADLEAAVARLDGNLEAAVARLDAKIEAVAAASEANLETAVARLEALISGGERRTILAVLAIAGLLFAALRFFG